jgi:hypothetical protein
MTFLELARKVAQESGTTSGINLPGTVTGQTGHLKNIVSWTADAWNIIQRQKSDWRWMRREFEKTILADLGTYDPSSVGADRHSKWITSSEVTLSNPTDTTGRENHLLFVEWGKFRALRMTGAARLVRSRPSEWSISPRDEFVMWPIPDIVYTVRGEYQQSPQTLAADADVPEMPEQHHDLIWQEALLLLAVGTESFDQVRDWNANASRSRSSLVQLQTPQIRFDKMRPIA